MIPNFGGLIETLSRVLIYPFAPIRVPMVKAASRHHKSMPSASEPPSAAAAAARLFIPTIARHTSLTEKAEHACDYRLQWKKTPVHIDQTSTLSDIEDKYIFNPL